MNDNVDNFLCEGMKKYNKIIITNCKIVKLIYFDEHRAASTEPRDSVSNTVSSRVANGRTSSLKKRSVSLEQTTQEQV